MTLNVHYNSKCKITIIILNRKVNSLIYIEFYQYYQFINIILINFVIFYAHLITY